MAIPGQPLQGGLGAMAPKPPTANLTANPAQPNEAKDAARISAMQQDTILSPEEVARKAMVDRKAQSEALEAQLQLLTQSLDARMNPGYNVPLMNLAAGLLKPTRTGSFGESLGYGLENYAKSSQEEMAQKQLVEKQRLEYMQKMADLQNQRSMTDFQMAELGPRTTLLTGAETPPGAAQAGPAAAAGAPAMPSVAGSNRPMTIDRVKQAYAIDPSGKLGKQFEEQLKMEQEAIKLQRGRLNPTPEGVFNLDTGQYEKTTPYLEKPVNFDFGPLNPPGQNNRPATQDQIQRWNKVNKRDSQAILDFAVGEGWLAAPSGASSETPAPVDSLGRRSTVPSQDALEKERLAREAEQAKVLENQKLDITDNAKIRQGIYQAGRDSYGQVLSSEQLYRLATDPKTSGAFGVLQGNDIKSAILGAIAEGVQTPGGSIKFGGIEDAVRKMTGTKEEVNAALQAARYYAELELNYARTYLKGQGAVSDNERKIVGKIGGSLSDTPQVAAAKAETMMARSAYDKQLSDVYYQWEQKNPGKMVKEFERTPEFTKLQSQFNEHMGLLNEKYFPSSASRPPAATPAPAAAPPAASPAPAAPRNAVNESPLDRFKAEKARRAAQGN
jgi:hypothetical protein